MDKNYTSYAGYIGALFFILFTFILARANICIDSYTIKYAIIGAVFVVMVVFELLQRYRFVRRNNLHFFSISSDKNSHIIRSVWYRYWALFIPFLMAYTLVQNHYYFTLNHFFDPTRKFFDYLLYIFLIGGVPYLFVTRKYLDAKVYEFNDYSILTLIAFKSIFQNIFRHKRNNIYKNRRILKVWRLYLVNLFFLTLMARFFINEIDGFEEAYTSIVNKSFNTLNWYKQYKTYFLLFFHLIFIVDVGIATIGYSFASRWLNNRTKSVDATWSGWVVALMCYPPLNSAFTSQFISYQGLPTYQLITNEYVLAVILAIVLLLYMIYVWATAALGFRFSNLTNRGIVEHGPYAVVRHPAYSAKNLAWWVDNTFVLTNIWATIGMVLWNLIYIFRALTEERHLCADKSYQCYVQKVKYKFIPKII